jgi:hypothetical protein
MYSEWQNIVGWWVKTHLGIYLCTLYFLPLTENVPSLNTGTWCLVDDLGGRRNVHNKGKCEIAAAQHVLSSFSSPCFSVKIVYNYGLRGPANLPLAPCPSRPHLTLLPSLPLLVFGLAASSSAGLGLAASSSAGLWIGCQLLCNPLDWLPAPLLAFGLAASSSAILWIGCQLLCLSLDWTPAPLLTFRLAASSSAYLWIGCQLLCLPLDWLPAPLLTFGLAASSSACLWIGRQLLCLALDWMPALLLALDCLPAPLLVFGLAASSSACLWIGCQLLCPAKLRAAGQRARAVWRPAS